MRESGLKLRAGLAILMLAALAGCGQKHEAVRHCVDEEGASVSDDKCAGTPQAGDKHKYAWVYSPVPAK